MSNIPVYKPVFSEPSKPRYISAYPAEKQEGYPGYARITKVRKSRLLRMDHTGLLYLKTSVPSGEDRQGAFVRALRKFYNNPSIDFPKYPAEYPSVKRVGLRVTQLVGLPAFGRRVIDRTDEKEGYVAKYQTDHEWFLENGIKVEQQTYNDLLSLTDAEGPRQLCEAFKDAIIGLRNAFRLGYVHRNINSTSIQLNNLDDASSFGFEISKDGKNIGSDPRPFSGFIADWSYSQKMGSERDFGVYKAELIPPIDSTSATVLLHTKDVKDFKYYPIYDLEAICWGFLKNVGLVIDHHMKNDKIPNVGFLARLGVVNKYKEDGRLVKEQPTLVMRDDKIQSLLDIWKTADEPDKHLRGRLALLESLDDILTSQTLAPFKELLQKVLTLAQNIHAYTEDHSDEEYIYTNEMNEDAFNSYLTLFYDNMPEETSWQYLKECTDRRTIYHEIDDSGDEDEDDEV